MPMESRSQADSEAADVKIDEDSSQDRDKCNSKEVANNLKDMDTLIRQLQPCAKDEGVTALLEEKKQERDELKIQLQNHKPLRHRLRLATEARAKASKALEVAKLEEADIVELLALKRAEVDQFKATLLWHNNNVELLELRYRTEAGNAELCHFESPGVQTVTSPLSPVQRAARFLVCLNSRTRDVFDAFCTELEQTLRTIMRVSFPVLGGPLSSSTCPNALTWTRVRLAWTPVASGGSSSTERTSSTCVTSAHYVRWPDSSPGTSALQGGLDTSIRRVHFVSCVLW